MKRYLILLMVGVAISTQAENMYTFKDSKGQTLLTNVVNNGQSSKTINHAETETLKSEKQDDGGEYYTGDVSSDIEVLNQQAQQREDHLANLANNRYVFKDSKGQVLLTNVVNNGKPAGENFTRFTQKVKVTYYPDTQTTYQYNGSAWEMIYSDKNKKIYIDVASIRLDPDYLSHGLLMWEKIVFNKVQTTDKKRYDEMIVLHNVDCSKNAYKYDEIILKNKGKVVYRQSQDSLIFPTYSYAEPDSKSMEKVQDTCRAWQRIKDVGLQNGEQFYQEYILPSKSTNKD